MLIDQVIRKGLIYCCESVIGADLSAHDHFYSNNIAQSCKKTCIIQLMVDINLKLMT